MTTCPPETAPLYSKISDAFSSTQFWVWSQSVVWHGGKSTNVDFDIEPNSLKVGQKLGISTFPNGELHVYVDGKDVGTPWNNLPTDTPLYGVVGLGETGDNHSSFMLSMNLVKI